MNKKRYFEWLCRRVNPTAEPYFYLLNRLQSMSFMVSSFSPTDERRARCGRDLRHYFAREDGEVLNESDENEPCSVLECLVALSNDIDDILGEPEEDYEYIWFWNMMSNLHLNEYHDSKYDDAKVQQILNRWMARTYKPNGEGGLFPLKHPYSNQKYVGIWEQAASYINENY